MTSKQASSVTDGRSARAERTREAVAAAMLSLIDEGDLKPTAQRIAERAGVSLRSVFHHFEDLEGLLGAVADRQLRRIHDLVHPLPVTGPLAGRIAIFVAERARVLEAISPVHRAAMLEEPFSPAISSRLGLLRGEARQQTERVFQQELDACQGQDREDLLAALAAVSGWPAWEALRSHQGLAHDQAERVLARILTGLLSKAEPSE